MLDKLCIYQKLPYDQSWLAPWLSSKYSQKKLHFILLSICPRAKPHVRSPTGAHHLWHTRKTGQKFLPLVTCPSQEVSIYTCTELTQKGSNWVGLTPKNLYTVLRWWEGTRNPSLLSASIHWYSKEIRKGMVFPGCLPFPPLQVIPKNGIQRLSELQPQPGQVCTPHSQPSAQQPLWSHRGVQSSVCVWGGLLPLWDFRRFLFDFLVLTSANTQMLPVELGWTRLLNCVSAHVSVCVCMFIQRYTARHHTRSTLPHPIQEYTLCSTF